MTERPWLTPEEAAEWLGITVAKLGRLRARGLPYVVLSADEYRYTRSSVQAWIDGEVRSDGTTSLGNGQHLPARIRREVGRRGARAGRAPAGPLRQDPQRGEAPLTIDFGRPGRRGA